MICSTLTEKGAATVAQGEASCVVNGLPKEAVALGGAGRGSGLSHDLCHFEHDLVTFIRVLNFNQLRSMLGI